MPIAPPTPTLPSGYRIVSDPASIDARLGDIHAALNGPGVYWGKARTVEMLRTQMQQSWRNVIILYGGEGSEGELAAYGRVVGDGCE